MIFFKHFFAAALAVSLVTSCSKNSAPVTNPKIKDLGVVSVLTGEPIRCDMGDNKTCVIMPTIITNGAARFVKMKITIQTLDSNGTIKEMACPQLQTIAGESAEIQVGDVGVHFKTKI